MNERGPEEKNRLRVDTWYSKYILCASALGIGNVVMKGTDPFPALKILVGNTDN